MRSYIFSEENLLHFIMILNGLNCNFYQSIWSISLDAAWKFLGLLPLLLLHAFKNVNKSSSCFLYQTCFIE